MNVIKSREAKLFRDLGLDFTSSIISVTQSPVVINDLQKTITGGYYEIKLIAPKKRKTYPAFVVKKDEPNTN